MAKKTEDKTNDQPAQIAVSADPRKRVSGIAAITGRSSFELQCWFEQAPDEIKTAFLAEQDAAKAVDLLSSYFATDKKTSIE